jgi:hypothetical protein
LAAGFGSTRKSFKEEGMRSLLYLVLLCELWGCWVVACQPPASDQSADATAVAFYKWYVREIDQGHIPFSSSHDQLKEYVSSALMKRLDPRKGAALDADYFLKAQDTMEDWAEHVTASTGKVTGNTAQTTVTLGATSESRHDLLVELIQEDGKWKIERVSSVHKPQ